MTGSVSFVATLTNPANFFVAALYDTSNPGVVIDTVVPTKAGSPPYYTTPFQVTFGFSLQQDVVYRVILWENSTPVVGGVSRVSGDLKASLNSITLRTNLYLRAGISAGFDVGTFGYVDPGSTLKGWQYWLELFGTGTLEENTDYTLDANNDWTFINGMNVSDGLITVIHFYPQVSAASAPAPSLISSGVLITDDITLDNTYVNKALWMQGIDGYMGVTLPALSGMTDFALLNFYSSGGVHINGSLICQGTDKILFAGSLVSVLTLAQGEQAILYKANGVYNIAMVSDSVKLVGQLVHGYSTSMINILQFTGQLISRVNYARLWAFVQANPSIIVPEANWLDIVVANGQNYFKNKGKFSTGDGSTTLRLPDLRVYGYTKAVDGTSFEAGKFDSGTVGKFVAAVEIPIGDSFLGPAGGTWLGIPGRGQANSGIKDFNQTFNDTIQNTTNATGIIVGIRF